MILISSEGCKGTICRSNQLCAPKLVLPDHKDQRQQYKPDHVDKAGEILVEAIVHGRDRQHEQQANQRIDA